jgi:hypothetical protein
MNKQSRNQLIFPGRVAQAYDVLNQLVFYGIVTCSVLRNLISYLLDCRSRSLFKYLLRYRVLIKNMPPQTKQERLERQYDFYEMKNTLL